MKQNQKAKALIYSTASETGSVNTTLDAQPVVSYPALVWHKTLSGCKVSEAMRKKESSDGIASCVLITKILRMRLGMMKASPTHKEVYREVSMFSLFNDGGKSVGGLAIRAQECRCYVPGV